MALGVREEYLSFFLIFPDILCSIHKFVVQLLILKITGRTVNQRKAMCRAQEQGLSIQGQGHFKGKKRLDFPQRCTSCPS